MTREQFLEAICDKAEGTTQDGKNVVFFFPPSGRKIMSEEKAQELLKRIPCFMPLHLFTQDEGQNDRQDFYQLSGALKIGGKNNE